MVPTRIKELEKLELNVETSNHLPKSDIGNIESTNQKMEQTTSLNLHKWQRKQIALKNTDFFMELDNVHSLSYKDNYASKSTRCIKVYHQNIRGLGMKSEEILGHLYPEYPQVLCLTEHHFKNFQIKHKVIENYNLGAYYCRNQHEKGGVAIYTHKSIQSTKINMDTYCKEKDIEICAIKFTYYESKISIITLYRSPIGNFEYFLHRLEELLQALYDPSIDIIICGDLNVDYRVENERKHQLNNLLHSFNPYPTAFPYGNGMVLHFYQQQESSTTKTVHKVINKGLKTYV